MKLLGQTHTLDHIGIGGAFVLGAAKEHTDGQNTAVEGAADTARLAHTDGHTGSHTDHIFRHIQFKIGTDDFHHRFTAKETFAERFFRFLLNFCQIDGFCIDFHIFYLLNISLFPRAC